MESIARRFLCKKPKAILFCTDRANEVNEEFVTRLFISQFVLTFVEKTRKQKSQKISN